MSNIRLLVLPACAAFVVAVVHSAIVRGPRTAWLFFTSILAFGILRGNLVHYFSKGNTPYKFSIQMPQIGNGSVFEAVGWALAMYLSWCLAERFLSWRGQIAKNVFSVALAASACMMFFCIMLELAAEILDWWHWQWPMEKNPPADLVEIGRGITPWFSIGFNFFLVWLTFAYVKKINWRWGFVSLFASISYIALLAIHEIHVGGHRIDVTLIAHFLMYLFIVPLPLFFFLETKQVIDFSTEGARGWKLWAKRLDMIALAIVIGTVFFGVIIKAKEAELVIFMLLLPAFGAFSWWWSEKGGRARHEKWLHAADPGT